MPSRITFPSTEKWWSWLSESLNTKCSLATRCLSVLSPLPVTSACIIMHSQHCYGNAEPQVERILPSSPPGALAARFVGSACSFSSTEASFFFKDLRLWIEDHSCRFQETVLTLRLSKWSHNINTVFSGRKPCQEVYKVWRSGHQVHCHHQGDEATHFPYDGDGADPWNIKIYQSVDVAVWPRKFYWVLSPWIFNTYTS